MVIDLRGSTPFEDMIFYLWTDSNEICTAYVKLKINHILFLKNFWFSFWENYDFHVFEGYLIFFFFMNRSQRPSMLEQKQGQFWNLHQITNKTLNPDFWFFLFHFFSGLKKVANCNFYSKIFPHQKNKTKIKNRDSMFCAEFDADSKTVLVFF